MIKIDTEGHDVVILDDLDPRLRPPVIWVEWFREYKYFKYDRVNKIYSIEVKKIRYKKVFNRLLTLVQIILTL